MKTSPSFEIKVALLGNVSAGKTTVLNALLKEKYSEVAMKRTTAGVNYFYVYSKNPSESTTTTKEAEEEGGAQVLVGQEPANEWNSVPDQPKSAQETLEEITLDNREKLSEVSSEVQEKFFEIQVDEHLVDMRTDTKLVLVDIPGLNEAGVFNKYKQFVKKHWHTFDCVVVVMDGKQGVNTEDQVFLLNFVEENLQKKHVPVIILCNKVDDRDDIEQGELVKEAQREVDKIFCTRSADNLEAIQSTDSTRSGTFVFGAARSPIFVPVSAIHAYIQLAASRMSFETFQCFDPDLIEKLGREQLGRRHWNKLDEEEKSRQVYEIISDEQERKQVLNESNFGVFLDALNYFVGGPDTQMQLLRKQFDTELDLLLQHQQIYHETICGQLRKLYDTCATFVDKVSDSEVLSLEGTHSKLRDCFWRRFGLWKLEAFKSFKQSWATGNVSISQLSAPFKELKLYYSLASDIGWEKEASKTILEMKRFLNEYLAELLNRHVHDVNERTSSAHPAPRGPGVDAMIDTKTYQWSCIFGSILLLSQRRIFVEASGALLAMVRTRLPDLGPWMRSSMAPPIPSECPSCRKPGRWVNEGVQKQPCPTCSLTATSVRHRCGHCNYALLFDYQHPDNNCSFRKTSGVQRLSTSSRHRRVLPPDFLHVEISQDGTPVPKYGPSSWELFGVKQLAQPSDPEHFGHIPWLFCEFMESLGEAAAMVALEDISAVTKAPPMVPQSNLAFNASSLGSDSAAAKTFTSESTSSGGFTFGVSPESSSRKWDNRRARAPTQSGFQNNATTPFTLGAEPKQFSFVKSYPPPPPPKKKLCPTHLST